VLNKKPVPAPSASWSAHVWPDAILPLPLDERLHPVDARKLGQIAAGALPACRAVFVAPAASELHPDLFASILAAMAERPDIGIFYGDDAVVDGAGQVSSVHCKPAFNPALLMADDYIGFPLVIRVSALASLTPDFGRRTGNAAWFRLLLDAISAGIGIDRIPQTLIASPLARPKAKRAARADVLDRWFQGSGAPLRTAPGLTPDTLEIRRSLDARP
jgi:hypothetical protein